MANTAPTNLTPSDLDDQTRTQRQQAGIASDPAASPGVVNSPALSRRTAPVPGGQNPDVSTSVDLADLGEGAASAQAPLLTRRSFAGVQSNGASVPNSAESIGGRQPIMGQMINGVQTFSDGSIPGTPRTISSDQMATLTRSSLQPADPYLGAEGSVGSAATGLGGAAGTLTRDQGVGMVTLSRRNLPGSYDPTASASDYASDLASIASRDPRSVLGRASWNSYADDVWRRNTGQRQHGAGDLASAAAAMFNARNQAGNENARDQTSYGNEINRGMTSLYGADLRGRYGEDMAQTRAGAYEYGADQRADATRYAADARANAPKIDGPTEAAYSRAYQSALKRGTAPEQARDEANAFLQSLKQNRQPQYVVGNSSTSAPRIPQGAIDYLRSNPNLADQFDAKYGGGAASQYLRNQ